MTGECHNTTARTEAYFEPAGACSSWAVAAGGSAHPILTCRVRWRRPWLRCRNQGITLLSCGVMSTSGHMLGCAVIRYHLRHTRGTDAALQDDAEHKYCRPAPNIPRIGLADPLTIPAGCMAVFR